MFTLRYTTTESLYLLFQRYFQTLIQSTFLSSERNLIGVGWVVCMEIDAGESHGTGS